MKLNKMCNEFSVLMVNARNPAVYLITITTINKLLCEITRLNAFIRKVIL